MHPILGPKYVGIGRKVRLRSKKTLPNLVDKIAHWDNQRSDIILCRGISAVIIAALANRLQPGVQLSFLKREIPCRDIKLPKRPYCSTMCSHTVAVIDKQCGHGMEQSIVQTICNCVPITGLL